MSPDERAVAALPAAAALVCAVVDRDAVEIERILNADGLDWRALAVVLAAHVPETTRLGEEPPMGNRRQVRTVLQRAAELFDATPEAILSESRNRNIADARAVAMAALRNTGHTYRWIGHHFDRDHTTVQHAVARVGADQRLRGAAQHLTDLIGGRLYFNEDVA